MTAASDHSSWRARMPRSSLTGGECGSVDPGRLVRARVVEDRGPVVAGPDLADLAVPQEKDVDCVPVNSAPGGGDAQQGTFLRAAHDLAHDDLVPRAEDILHGAVHVGQRGHHAGKQPGDVGPARDRAHGAAVPLDVLVQVAGGVVAMVLVEHVLEECPYLSLVG